MGISDVALKGYSGPYPAQYRCLSRPARQKSGIEREELKCAHYAIHPGGPKIVENIAEKLGLEPDQTRHTVAVLQNYGNMSSATLPHIWERILKDDTIKAGERIVSMAFGPGLTICGSVFERGKNALFHDDPLHSSNFCDQL